MKERTFTYKEMENLAYLAADIMTKLPFDDSRDKVAFLAEKAKEFDKRLGGKDEEVGDYDYIEELEKFEKEILGEVSDPGEDISEKFEYIRKIRKCLLERTELKLNKVFTAKEVHGLTFEFNCILMDIDSEDVFCYMSGDDEHGTIMMSDINLATIKSLYEHILPKNVH